MKRFAVVAALALVISVLVGTPAHAAPDPGPVVPLGPLSVQARRHGSVADRVLGRAGAADRTRPTVGGSRSPVASPESVAVDPSTETIYVPSSADATVKVIDAQTCNARRLHCHAPVAAMPGRGSPIGIVVDPGTHTVYVVDFDTKAVLVFDGAHCNARTQTGCAAAPVALPVADEPIDLVLNPRTHTAYVGTAKDSIDLFDTAACNAEQPKGCTRTLATISAGPGPAFLAVDPATDTLYAPENGPESDEESGTTVSVIDLAHCRAGSTTGCSQPPFTATVGVGPIFAVVDAAADTVYVSNQADNTISVLPRSTCNGHDHSGCPTSTPTSLPTGLNPQLMAVDRVTRTLFVQVQDANVLQAVDTRACNAHHTSGCAARSRAAQTGGEPFWLTFDQRTRTVYVVDHADGVLEALDARACSAVSRRGCRREVPAFPGLGTGARLDERRHTLYEPGPAGVLSLTDTDRCRVGRASRCRAATTRVTVSDEDLYDKAVDPATHTLYVEQYPSHTVAVIDTRTCNAVRHDQCAPRALVHLPGDEFGNVGLNARTHTLYVTQGEHGTVAVLRGAHCNATDLSGCGSTPQIVTVGVNPFTVAVDERTNTVYIANYAEVDGFLTLLPGAACDAGTAGCRVVARTSVPEPTAQAVDEATRTLFVPRLGDDTPGGVSLVDIRACNAGHTSGCGTSWPQIPGPRGVFSAEVVSSGHTLFTQNLFDSTVSVIDIRHCNSTERSGCPTRPRRIAVGYGPVASAVSRRSHTVYVTTFADAGQSLVDVRHPCRQHLCFR